MESLATAANRGSISTGYDIDHSCKFEADNTEYLERDPSSAGDRQKFTTSMWVKRTELGQASTIFGVYPTSSAGNSTVMQFGFMSNDKFQLGLQTYYVFNTNRLFRDTSAWYHIVVAFDTTQSTAANRIKLYVNGTQETSFAVESYPSQNHSTGVNFTEPHRIGTLISNSWYFSGYIAEVNHVDGSQLAPTDFGEVDDDSGIWKPKKYTGSYGTNGFYLDFADASDLGDDESGNGNDFTENNIAAADQATDTPTNNFTTFNPLNPTYGTSVISEGGTRLKGSGQNTFDNIQTTIGVTKGKWYYEVEPQVDIATRNTAFGVVNLDTAVYTGDHYGAAGFWSGGFDDGARIWYYFNGGSPGAPTINYGTGSGDTAGTIGVALDLDNATLKFYIRNSLQTNQYIATSLPAGTYAFFGDVQGGGAPYINFNFGGYTLNSISSAESDANGYGTFEYAPPSGYYSLCTKNLAEFG